MVRKPPSVQSTAIDVADLKELWRKVHPRIEAALDHGMSKAGGRVQDPPPDAGNAPAKKGPF